MGSPQRSSKSSTASSSRWALKLAHQCVGMSIAAGRSSSSTSGPRQRREFFSQRRLEESMSIELYAFPPSPRAFKVMALANHLGLDWSLRMLDLTKGEQRAPEYAALNPNMRMPTLKEGDYVLWESSAILQYLASKKPE